MGKILLRRVMAIALLAVSVGSVASHGGAATGVEMDDIKAQVATVAAAETAAAERSALTELRHVLAGGGTTFSVMLQQTDGSEVSLAAGTGEDPAAPVVIAVTRRGQAWRSKPFVPVDLNNLYVLFRE